MLLAVPATKHPVIVCEVSQDLFIYSIGQSTQNALKFIQDKQTLRMCCKHLLFEQGALFSAADRAVSSFGATKTQSRLEDPYLDYLDWLKERHNFFLRLKCQTVRTWDKMKGTVNDFDGLLIQCCIKQSCLQLISP